MLAIDILKLHNIKRTPARLAILNALKTFGRPLSELEIKEEMRENYDRITFYRNMQTLSAAGVIHKIVIDNTLIRYGLSCCSEHHTHCNHKNEHAHFYCEQCQSVECLEQVHIPDFALPAGYKLHDNDIIIKGRCVKCNS